ncbi:MAG: aminotransferase class I/II-fold pyridoxal phosphate-dependent enzyme [Clostridia bacterium]|nr:aminotransferase class I/II-fold pyridoxal phosphate-dependent enzyme [Clostridia bacterium]
MIKITLQDGRQFDAKRLEEEKWLSYLYYTENHGINMERVEVVEQLSGRETLSYVLRTLDILEEDYKAGLLQPNEYEIVKMTLQWSEVSKGGTVKEREYWRNKEYTLDIHNLASAKIYQEFYEDTLKVNLSGLHQYQKAFDEMGLKYYDSQTNFIYVEIPKDATEVFNTMLHDGIIIRPQKLPGYPDALRISIGTADENERTIRSLKKALA